VSTAFGDTSGHAVHQHADTSASSSGYGVPEYYNEVGYSSGSGYASGGGYEEVSYDEGSGLPDWLLPALLIICGCALLIPSFTIIPTPPMPMDRKKRAIEEEEATTFSVLRDLANIFNNKDCIMRVGCEMVEVERSGYYPALNKAFSPLTSMYGSYYTEKMCSNLDCPLREDYFKFGNHL